MISHGTVCNKSDDRICLVDLGNHLPSKVAEITGRVAKKLGLGTLPEFARQASGASRASGASGTEPKPLLGASHPHAPGVRMT